MKSESTKVQDFIDKIRMIDFPKYEILEKLRKIVFRNYPTAKEKMMYGGIILSLHDDFGGLFVYKNHLSFEFSNGFEFKDPNKFLEGKGKFRRHLKIRSMDDIKIKRLEYYLKQI